MSRERWFAAILEIDFRVFIEQNAESYHLPAEGGVGGVLVWEDNDYCWVVICKNWAHLRQNIFHGHRIPLGVTDAVAICPVDQEQFPVRCDKCGKEYLYKRGDVFRYEQVPPESFIPHPLFKQED